MPQPLPKKYGPPRFGSSQLAQRPVIATMMMVCLNRFAEIDHRWGIILAEILEAEAGAGVAMYNAVENDNSKRHLLLAASAKRLSTHYQVQLTELLDSVRRLAKLRNAIAHEQWGGVDEDLDGIVLGNGRWAAEATANQFAVQHGVETVLGSAEVSRRPMRYTARDFETYAQDLAEIIDRQVELTRAFKNFRKVTRETAAGMMMEGLKGLNAKKPPPR